MADSLYLEIADFEHLVHTGIYSEETGRPQPLRFTIRVKLKACPRYEPDTSLDEAMRIKPERHHFEIERGAAPAQPRHMSLTGG